MPQDRKFHCNGLAASAPAGSWTLSSVALLVAASLAAPAAHAQESEIVVTARKKEERIIDVPASVRALTAEEIELRGGIPSPESLANVVPGVDFYNEDSRPVNQQVVIRGQGTGSFINTERGVGQYFNGLFSAAGSFSGFGPSDFFDLERIEVLRGPQGGLYGRNSLGGSVNLISARPNDTASAKLTAGYGSEERKVFEGIGNLPIIDGIAVRAGVKLTTQPDGFFENRATGNAFDRAREDLYRVSALLEPTDRTEIVIQFDASSLANVGDNQIRTGIDGTTGVLNPANNDVANGRFRDDDERIYQETTNWHASFEHDFDFATLTVLGQQRERTTTLQFDLDDQAGTVTCGPLFNDFLLGVFVLTSGTETSTRCYGIFADDVRLNAAEARLAGEFSLADRTIGWLVGVDYRDVEADLVFATEGSTGPTASPFIGLAFPGAISTGTPLKNQYAQTIQEDESIAFYASLDIEALFPKFSLSADVRHTSDERDTLDRNFLITGGPCVFNGVETCTVVDFGVTLPSLAPQTASLSFDNTNWTVAGRYEWTESLNTYVRVGTAYRAGGANPRSTTFSQTILTYDEEQSISYELGAKGQFSIAGVGAFDASAAVFHQTTEDVIQNIREQVTTSVGLPLVVGVLENLGDQRVTGIEVETSGVMPAPDWLGGVFQPTFSASWAEGEITDSDEIFQDLAGGPAGSAEGTQVSRLPKYKISANLAYLRPLGTAFGDKVTGTLNLAYNQQWGGKQSPNNVLDLIEFHNLDVRAAIGWNGWQLAGLVRNATDEDAPVFRNGGITAGGATVITNFAPRQPRSWLVSVSKAFGG